MPSPRQGKTFLLTLEKPQHPFATLICATKILGATARVWIQHKCWALGPRPIPHQPTHSPAHPRTPPSSFISGSGNVKTLHMV